MADNQQNEKNTIELTPDQQTARDAMEKRILVSAAAGSGKTAVLVQRVLRLLRQGVPLQRMLIITYTNAAAAELKEKIQRNLSDHYAEEPKIYGEALDSIAAAHISTIHTFGATLLREFFQILQLDPACKVAPELQTQQLLHQAWTDAMNQLLQDREPSFMSLAEAYDNQELQELTLELNSFMMSLPRPQDWLDRAVQFTEVRPFAASVWKPEMLRQMKLSVEQARQYLYQMEDMMQESDSLPVMEKVLTADAAELSALSVEQEDPAAMQRSCAGAAFIRMPNKPKDATEAEILWLERFKKQRNSMKEIIKGINDEYDLDEEHIELELTNLNVLLKGMAQLLRQLAANYRALKHEEGVIDFTDMEQLTNELLSQPDIRDMVRSRFDHIFVDEFQDVSAVQFGLLQNLSGPDACVFMVGDAKQSIYRFRNADPTIFLQMVKNQRFGSDEDAMPVRVIYLQKNFRSRGSVLLPVNEVFEKAMRENVTEMDYKDQDRLVTGRQGLPAIPAEILLLDYDGNAADRLVRQARMVAARIHRLVTEPRDPVDPASKPYSYRDITILMSQVSSSGPKVASILGANGIPVYFDGSAGYYETTEIKRMKALLAIINNSYRDPELIAALKMPPFCFGDVQLAQIRMIDNRGDVSFAQAFRQTAQEDTPLGSRCRYVQESLERWRMQVQQMPLSDFIWQVARSSGYYAWCGTRRGGELKQSNLRMLAKKAADWQQYGRTGLRGFLTQMTEESADKEKDTVAHTMGEHDDLVRIMTIHKSKGLEFPVVILMNAAKKFDFSRSKPIHPKLGISLPYYDEENGFSVNDTLIKKIIAGKKRTDELSERCRLLYVAMTRPREQLIVTGAVPGGDRREWHMRESDARVNSAGCMLDWIMQSVCDMVDGPVTEEPQDRESWITQLMQPLEADETGEIQGDALDTIREQALRLETNTNDILWWNRAEPESAPPRKSSVTSWVHRNDGDRSLPDLRQEEDSETKRQSLSIQKPMALPDLPARPDFMLEKKVTPAQRGTAMHRMLMLLPPEKLRGLTGAALSEAVTAQLETLHDGGVVSDEEMKLISVNELCRFYHSDLGQRVLASPEVHREWGFDLMVDGTLLQGVIDCVFVENGQWILLDYKTDHYTDAALFTEHHRPQLELYAQALETLSGRKVAEMYLYALSYGEICRV